MVFRKAMRTLAALSLVLVSVLPAHAQDAAAPAAKSTAKAAKSTAATTAKSSATEAKSTAAKTADKTAAAAKVDINTATKDQLMALPGIGTAIADKIIANRPFANKKQLLDKGLVNAGQYKAMSPHIIASQASMKAGAAAEAGAKKATSSTKKKPATTK